MWSGDAMCIPSVIVKPIGSRGRFDIRRSRSFLTNTRRYIRRAFLGVNATSGGIIVWHSGGVVDRSSIMMPERIVIGVCCVKPCFFPCGRVEGGNPSNCCRGGYRSSGNMPFSPLVPACDVDHPEFCPGVDARHVSAGGVSISKYYFG